MADADAPLLETTSEAGDPPPAPAAATPPKRLPLIWALLLLLLLPAIAAGVWFGGRLHRIDDKPAAPPAAHGTPQPMQGARP